MENTKDKKPIDFEDLVTSELTGKKFIVQVRENRDYSTDTQLIPIEFFDLGELEVTLEDLEKNLEKIKLKEQSKINTLIHLIMGIKMERGEFFNKDLKKKSE